MNRAIGLALTIALVVAPGAFAQISTGNIYGKAVDESGAVLPGSNISLTGDSGSQSSVSGSEGEFRFLGLDKGTYELSVSLGGFTTVTRKVILVTNQNIDLTFTLRVATVEETLLVTAETPVVDTKKLGTNTTMTYDELHRVPTARDPWAVLATVPGVVMDRVNIAGNEGGQQSSFQAKGSDDYSTTWNLDGVQIEDVAAAGASPVYFDYDAFDEIAVTTGGTSLATKTGAIGINLVTKRGTNRWRGSARGLLAHDDMQSSNIGGTELEGDDRLQGNDKANHIQQIADYGFEIGGPIIKDKLHIWASYGQQDIRVRRLTQTADKTKLESWNGKLNWQISPNTTASVFYFTNAKIKIGRDPGGGVEHADSFLVDQGGAYEDFLPGDIHGFLKFEVSHIFSPDFFMTAKYSNFDTGFGLASRVPASTGTLDFNNGVSRGGWYDYQSTRPLKNVTDISGNYFASGWGGNHEVKFGFGYKKVGVNSTTVYGGTDERLMAFDSGPGYAYVTVNRDGVTSYEGKNVYAFLGDTFTKDRLSLNLGIRFDSQKGNNAASSAPASILPDVLPAISYDGTGQGINWTSISPRAGLTYALNDSRKTVLRASFAQYASALNLSAVTHDNPVSASYASYFWNDTNGDGLPTASEIDLASGIQYFGGFDPANPTATVSPNRIDPDYKSPKETEFVVGLDHELIPDLAISGAYTYKRMTNQRDWNTRIGLTSADYTANAPVTGNGLTGNTFSPDPALVAASGGGLFKTNRPDYHQSFGGFELSLLKRISNKWMARVAFSYNDWTETIDGPGGLQNPTRTDTRQDDTNVVSLPGPQVNGGVVAPRSGGSGKGDIFQNATWQLSAVALYELPANFEVGASFIGREGNVRPLILRLSAGNDGRLRVPGTPQLDDTRYPNVYNLDLRLANSIRLGGERSLTIAAELFNVFNGNTELARQRDATASAFNRLDEILNPRILRVGARLSF